MIQPGDIRGEPIQPLYRQPSTEDAALNVVGSAFGLAGSAVAPFAELFSLHYAGRAFDAALNVGPKMKEYFKNNPNSLLPSTVKAFKAGLAGTAAEPAVGALATGALTATVKSAAAKAPKAAKGLSSGRFRGWARTAVNATFHTRPALTGIGIAAAAFTMGVAMSPNFTPEQQGFINSSNAMMARGAANRNRRRGY